MAFEPQQNKKTINSYALALLFRILIEKNVWNFTYVNEWIYDDDVYTCWIFFTEMWFLVRFFKINWKETKAEFVVNPEDDITKFKEIFDFLKYLYNIMYA